MRLQRIGGAAVCAAALAFAVIGTSVTGSSTVAANGNGPVSCPVSHSDLREALIEAEIADTTGLDNDYWAVVVNRQGVVCAVAYSNDQRDGQWLLSRQIAAAKAFTANGLSLDGAPLSTAQLYPWVQPGAPANPLFGLAG